VLRTVQYSLKQLIVSALQQLFEVLHVRWAEAASLAAAEKCGGKPGVYSRNEYWKERSVIRREDDVDGRASVTKDEERVLRGG